MYKFKSYQFSLKFNSMTFAIFFILLTISTLPLAMATVTRCHDGVDGNAKLTNCSLTTEKVANYCSKMIIVAPNLGYSYTVKACATDVS